MALLTREQILAAPAANNDSTDWREWSNHKLELKRHRNTEIDAHLKGAEDEIEGWFERHALAMSLVDPGYKRGSRFYATAVYAALAERFNMSMVDVRNLPLPDIYGLVRAYCRSERAKAIPDSATGGNFTPTDADYLILQALSKARGRRVKIVSLRVPGVGQKLLKRRLKRLEDHRLVDRDEGLRSGVTITGAGLNILKSATA